MYHNQPTGTLSCGQEPGYTIVYLNFEHPLLYIHISRAMPLPWRGKYMVDYGMGPRDESSARCGEFLTSDASELHAYWVVSTGLRGGSSRDSR